eukprot:2491276-Amphidinium_carterae.1
MGVFFRDYWLKRFSVLSDVPEDSCLEVGRERQPGFFETLLASNQQWLGFISRTHFRNVHALV